MTLADELREISKQNVVDVEVEIQKRIRSDIDSIFKICRYRASNGHYDMIWYLRSFCSRKYRNQIISMIKNHGLSVSSHWYDRRELRISWACDSR